MEREVLEQESKIYGRTASRPLSKYEETINACALTCCEQDATLLKDRNRLFKLAKERADSEGYQYKKRKSRSKVFGDGKETRDTTKHVKLVTEERHKRQSQLAEDIKSSTDTMKLLELQIEKFVNAEKYLQAAEMVTQISDCRTKLRRLQAELTKLQKADGRSKKYYSKRKTASKSKSLTSFNIPQLKVSPTTHATAGTSSSTSTELESDVSIQKNLQQRNEDPTGVESASIFLGKSCEKRLDMFSVSPPNTSPLEDVDGKSLHSISDHEDCIEAVNASNGVGNKGEQPIHQCAVNSSTGSYIASEACELSSPKDLKDKVVVQEYFPEKCEEQGGFLRAGQRQDDHSSDTHFPKAPQIM